MKFEIGLSYFSLILFVLVGFRQVDFSEDYVHSVLFIPGDDNSAILSNDAFSFSSFKPSSQTSSVSKHVIQ